MIEYTNYSCDKCAREFSRHCKHCFRAADKPPTRFKKKKTGCETPEYQKTTAPAQLSVPPMPKVKSSAPNPNFGYQPISQSSEKPKPPNTGSKVQKPCTYITPCDWCTKWDKKCDRKIPEHENETVCRPIDGDQTITLYNKKCESDADHEWEISVVSTTGTTCVCKKCGAHLRYFVDA